MYATSLSTFLIIIIFAHSFAVPDSDEIATFLVEDDDDGSSLLMNSMGFVSPTALSYPQYLTSNYQQICPVPPRMTHFTHQTTCSSHPTPMSPPSLPRVVPPSTDPLLNSTTTSRAKIQNAHSLGIFDAALRMFSRNAYFTTLTMYYAGTGTYTAAKTSPSKVTREKKSVGKPIAISRRPCRLFSASHQRYRLWMTCSIF